MISPLEKRVTKILDVDFDVPFAFVEIEVADIIENAGFKLKKKEFNDFLRHLYKMQAWWIAQEFKKFKEERDAEKKSTWYVGADGDFYQRGKSLLRPENFPFIKAATSDYVGEVVTDKWVLPAGAFGKGGGSL